MLHTANLHASIMDFRGLDSSIILILRGGILMSIGNIPESLSHAILILILILIHIQILILTLILILIQM